MAPPTSTHQDLTDEQLAALLNEDAKHTSARLTALTFGSQLTKKYVPMVDPDIATTLFVSSSSIS